MICPMRNAFATLNRQRRLSTAVHHDRPVGTMLRRSVSLEVQMEIGIGRTPDTWCPSYLLQRNVPSAEYAKLRKESLESEFGHIVGTHSSKSVSVVYRFGPFLALYRAAIISFHVLKLTIWRFFFRDIKERASKLGQALSTRPDILPPVYCQELAKLQDQIPPFPTHVAIKSIENELGIPVSEIFADISPEPIAAASIGQVYKAHLHSGELVAVKVQRPGISLLLTLDALLFHMIGGQLRRFAKARKDLLVAVNEMVSPPFHGQTCNQNSKDGITNKTKNESGIKVPKIYWDLTRKAVLTMEWLDGIKLTDETALKKASDIFLQDEVMGCRLDAESKARKTSESEDDAIMRRVMNGFGSLKEAVKLGPEVWTPMFIRIALNPQTHRFPFTLIMYSIPFPSTALILHRGYMIHSYAQVHSEDRPAKLKTLPCCRQNGKFSYGYASSPGKRSSMEDFYETRIDGVDGEIVGLFGVFDGCWTIRVEPIPTYNATGICHLKGFYADSGICYLLQYCSSTSSHFSRAFIGSGWSIPVVNYEFHAGSHGGIRAAEYVKQNLFSNLIKHPKFISDTKSAIGYLLITVSHGCDFPSGLAITCLLNCFQPPADAYNHTDSEFLKSENNQNRDAGSTASTAILVGNRLLVANVGDSRAVICRGGNAIAVSRDHKPDQSDERQRIENAGGFVMWAGTWRVGGVLAVSRAFGDRHLKQYVVADPEIQEEKIDNSLEFLILASDGLWDVVSNEEAVAMIKPIQDPEQAAKQLMQEAYQRGSADNITCVVVRFLVNQGGSSRNASATANTYLALVSPSVMLLSTITFFSFLKSSLGAEF
ncbi:putative aarF domain-containing protein kinase chloroplastic-like isoform X8 [Gossypium australe]|uniref:Putative aarF domain-containing protein kinase chloroplastic-like isoform X8 n=1 Tax=Gossypium australe TaxID=47621 RepID=A0A5B6X968_9ROSI|nr:putative aarF domain-containing protein kinase chloroplastic-like isoform X8 [Gossypium australe]